MAEIQPENHQNVKKVLSVNGLKPRSTLGGAGRVGTPIKKTGVPLVKIRGFKSGFGWCLTSRGVFVFF